MQIRRFLFLLFAALVFALGPPGLVAQSKTFTLTALNQCAQIGTSSLPTVGITLTGTSSLTLQPEVAINGGTAQNSSVTSTIAGSSSQATIVTSGVTNAGYKAPVGGFDTFLLCVSAYTSGSVTIVLNPSNAINAGLLGGGAPPAFSAVTAGTNGAALVEGTGGSLTPSGLGQVLSTGLQVTIGAPAPSYTMALTGGSFLAGHSQAIRLSLNTAAGQTWAGQEIALSNVSNGCATGGTCSTTVVAPTTICGALPCGGYSGYSVYQSDCTSTPCTGGELLVSGCSNITTSCTFGSAGAGAALPIANTAYAQPSSVGTNLCSPATNPFLYVQDISGVNFPAMGVDSANTGTNPPAPYNKLSVCVPFWVNDSGVDPPVGRNALVLINHLQNGVTVSNLNQDRGEQIITQNPVGDSGSHYALEGLQVQQNVNGNPIMTGTPDSEESGVSAQLSFSATGFTPGVGFGANAVRATHFRQIGAVVDSQGMNAIRADFVNNSTVTGGGLTAAAVQANCSSSVTAPSFACAALLTLPAATGVFANGMVGLRVTNNAAFAPNAKAGAGTGTGDWLIDNQQHNWTANLNAPAYLNNLRNSDYGALPVSAPLSVQGSVVTTGIIAPTQPTVPACSGGASTYTYQLVGVDGAGGTKAGAPVSTPGLCTNPLTVGNPGTITPVYTIGGANNDFNLGTVRIDIYRTAGPMSTGKIGSFTCANTNVARNGCGSFLDTGLAGDGTTPPVTDSTGGMVLVGLRRDANICRITADVPLTVNTANPFCSFNAPAVAQGWTYRCDILWTITGGTGTNNFAVGVNVQQTPTGTTNAIASVTTTASGTNTNGSAAISASGATNILTGATYTPAATVLPATISGSVLANVLPGTFAITATANGTTATGAVKAGTQCWVN
jgi:hypothetical protein